jgi:hypothetical protein
VGLEVGGEDENTSEEDDVKLKAVTELEYPGERKFGSAPELGISGGVGENCGEDVGRMGLEEGTANVSDISTGCKNMELMGRMPVGI